MDFRSSIKAWKWQVVYLFYLNNWGWVFGQLHYSITEESDPGTLVGNVAQDLGLNLADINKRRLSLGPEESSRYFAVDQKSGALTVNERIDRESLCGSSSSCLLHLEVVTEYPLELSSVEIEILDINDNSPTFSTTEQVIKITELLTSPGDRFPLETANDLDVGINDVSEYRLNPTPYFSLSVKNRKDGTLIAELILEKNLDREEIREHKLILTAVDGGEQPNSGSTQITIIVLDINDNTPVFDQSSYKISVLENLPLKTVIMKLTATDVDEGSNGEVNYFFDHHTLDSAKEIFDLNSNTGEIYIKGNVNFEESYFYELFVKAIDKGLPQLEGRCLVQVEVEDVNDNTPEIIFISKSKEIPENAPIGTVVGIITVRDKDSGRNGEIQLHVSSNSPFTIQHFKSRYSLVTSEYMDREKVSQYTIELIATDLGSPALQNKTIIVLNISDVNDNSPEFEQHVYNAYIKENNEPGTLLCTLSASDPDEGVNSNLIYSIAESQIDGSPVSSFVFINSHTGDIYAQRSFDYEHFQVLQFTARVEDSGFPKLFSNVSVFIFILDTNDNIPFVLYPENSMDQIAEEKIPKTASSGYLVTKISAVDLDAGHNAWLVYTLVESSSPNLFRISAYTGEIRTNQDIHESDNAEHRLVITVHDQGEPALSSTLTLLVNIVDNVVQENFESQDFLANSKSTADLTLYLIISLVAISLVSLITFIILLVKCFKREYYNNSCGFCISSKAQSKQFEEQYQPTLYLNTDGTLKYMEVRMAPAGVKEQCYPACFHSSGENTDFTFMRPLDFPHVKDIVAETEPNYLKESDQVR